MSLNFSFTENSSSSQHGSQEAIGGHESLVGTVAHEQDLTMRSMIESTELSTVPVLHIVTHDLSSH